MAWESIGLLKNAFNEYVFATIPNFASYYTGHVGSGNTQIMLGGVRGMNREPGTAEYQLGVAMGSAINVQEDIYRLEEPTPQSLDTYFFGDVGGSAIRLKINVSDSGSYNPVAYEPYVYRGLAPQQRLSNLSGSLAKDTSKISYNFYTWGMAVNKDTQEMYLMIITAGRSWDTAIGTPRYYDRAGVTIYILDEQGSTSPFNLWDIFHNSIPSGGGGGGEPYVGGGTSTSGGGENATFDLTSDDIDVPTLPSISASGAGLLTLYQVSLQNMHDFANYLWSPLFDVDTLKKLFNDPMDAIISLGMLPFTPTGGSTSNIFIGESDSGVSALRLVSQYYEIDMGSLLLDTFYDSALDLNPYTKVDLYLPYCGTVSINPDEFDGKSIHVVYHVDILTGACVVFVEDGSRVLVQSQGNILTAIPFTSKDFKSIFGAVLGDAAAAGAALFALPTGGISAAAAVGIVGGAAMNSVNSKLNMPHGGQCASTAGFLSVQKPYLIITRPAQCLPEDNAAYQGYPAYITETVGNLSGFIKISEAHFDGFTCTDGELKEIDRLLKEGVYVQ